MKLLRMSGLTPRITPGATSFCRYQSSSDYRWIMSISLVCVFSYFMSARVSLPCFHLSSLELSVTLYPILPFASFSVSTRLISLSSPLTVPLHSLSHSSLLPCLYVLFHSAPSLKQTSSLTNTLTLNSLCSPLRFPYLTLIPPSNSVTPAH